MKELLPPPSVLVVDDHADTADSLAECISIHGYRARAVYSGSEALNSASGNRPDIVIVDLKMPAMDGWELATYLAMTQKPPVLIGLSGDAAETDRYPAKFAMLLLKPIEPGVILDVIHRVAAVIGARQMIPRWRSER